MRVCAHQSCHFVRLMLLCYFIGLRSFAGRCDTIARWPCCVRLGPEDGGMSPTYDVGVSCAGRLGMQCVWCTKGWYMAACAETRVRWDHGRAKRLEALKKLVGCGGRGCIVLRHPVSSGAGQVRDGVHLPFSSTAHCQASWALCVHKHHRVDSSALHIGPKYGVV